MIYKKLSLNGLIHKWSDSETDASLTLYLQEPSPEIDKGRLYPCVIVCPGGGYKFTSDREAEPVALRYAAMGFSAAVLRYSTNRAKFPIQLLELSMVVAWLRRNKEFHIHPDKIAVCGFSAGGHLVGSLLNLWNSPVALKDLMIEQGENKPNAGILCYPVITTGKFSHANSFDRLLDGSLDQNHHKILSLEKSVNHKNPPCFLWHAANDPLVPVENSLLYATALHKFNIPMELHIYPEGSHGLSLGDYTTANCAEQRSSVASQWFMESVRFLNKIFEIPY